MGSTSRKLEEQLEKHRKDNNIPAPSIFFVFIAF